LPRRALTLHVGAILQQQDSQHWLPLGFFSKKLSKTKVNYSSIDRELLAAISGIRQQQFRLEGKQFQLLCSLTRVSPMVSSRQQRHLAIISQYTTHLVYVPGMSNVVADALSHPSSSIATTAAALS